MKHQQYKIIFFIITLVVLSSVWLFFSSNKVLDLNYGKDWWSIYFIEPKSKNIDFVIENHSSKNNFHWVVLSGNNKLDEGNAIIEKGALLNLTPDIPAEIENKKITIQVISADEKKEIYKNF